MNIDEQILDELRVTNRMLSAIVSNIPITDPDVLKACIPGIREVHRIVSEAKETESE